MVKEIVALLVIASIVSLQALDEKITVYSGSNRVITQEPSCLDERIVQFTHTESVNRCGRGLDRICVLDTGFECYHASCAGCGIVPTIAGAAGLGVSAAKSIPWAIGVSAPIACCGLSTLVTLYLYRTWWESEKDKN